MRSPKLVNNQVWWLTVDWTQGNQTIAESLDLNKSVVARRRKKLGFANSSSVGWPKGKKRTFSNRENLLGIKNRQVNDWDYEWPNKSKSGTQPTNRFCKAVKRIHGPACEICGYNKPEISNHCHHIIQRHLGGKHTIRNACVLCSRCHDEVHAGILELSLKILERVNGK